MRFLIFFVFAVVSMSMTVISIPMLLDVNVGVITAFRTSIRVVIANPVTMAMWGIIVAVFLLIGSLPFFVGLAVVMPVLGHAMYVPEIRCNSGEIRITVNDRPEAGIVAVGD